MLCCVCLSETDNGLQIFSEMGEALLIAQKVEQHLWFRPEANDKCGSFICQTCWLTVSDFHKFYQQAEQAHAEFQQSLATTNDIIKLEPDDETMMSDGVQYEIEIEDTIQSDVASREEDVSKNPLQEEIAENPLDDEVLEECVKELVGDNIDEDAKTANDDFEKSTECRESMDCEYETTSEYKEDSLSESEDDDESYSDDTKSNGKNKNKVHAPSDQAAADEKPSISKRKKLFRFDYQHAEAMIRKHIPLGCDMCVFVGTTFADIVNHFKELHPSVGPYIMCCDKKLTKRYYVAQHALKHEDPNCFNCKDCKKSFTTTCGLRAHNLNYHAPEKERTHCCDLCTKKFARQHLLELHKPSHIPREEWKYFCSKCPAKKFFASEYLRNIHENMMHKREKNVCHVCAKVIRDKYSFEKHVRLHFEESGPRVPCPYPDCSSWLKDEDNLRQHLKRHNPEGITYQCNICERVCKNRRALMNHKRYTHSTEVFACEHCDKTFKKSISLREHRTQHTGETLYKCPFCPRTFNSNANMHAHKKRQHPVEWDEWRRNKKGSSQQLLTNSNPLKTV